MINAINKVCLVAGSILFSATCFANVSLVPPILGTIVDYSCEGPAPKKEKHQVLYSTGGLWGFQQIHGDTSPPTSSLLDVSPWQYVLRIAAFEESPESFRMIKVKSGDLANLNDVAVGKTYSGTLEVIDSELAGKPFEMKVSVEIASYERVNTKYLRTQKVLMLKASFENFDGKNGNKTVDIEYIPSLKIVGAESHKIGEKVLRSCVALKLSFDETIRRSRNLVDLKLPPVGSKMTYACSGDTKRMTISVDTLNRENIGQFSFAQDDKPLVSSLGKVWQFYTQMGAEIKGTNRPPDLKFVGGFEALESPQRPGSYVGGLTFTSPKEKSESWQVKVTLFDKISLNSPYRGSENVFEIRTTRFRQNESVISKYYYSPKLMAPFMFILKSPGTIDRTCWLASIL